MNEALPQLTAGKTDDELIRMSHWHRPFLQQMIAKCPALDSALEIGCWKGETTVWLAQQGFKNVLAVDTFAGSAEHQGTHNLLAEFLAATKDVPEIKLRLGTSIISLAQMVAVKPLHDDWGFNFIYIDGSHDSRDVMADAVLSFHLLRPGGVMVFDDYLWEMNDDKYRTPRPAIDLFLAAFAGDIDQFTYGCQVAIQKK